MVPILTLSLKREGKTSTKNSPMMILTELLRKLLKRCDFALRASFLFLIQIYKVALRPFFGQACCFQPSCSCYAREAFEKHHSMKAIYLTLFRVLRCHPFSQGGIDPVPGVKDYE